MRLLVCILAFCAMMSVVSAKLRSFHHEKHHSGSLPMRNRWKGSTTEVADCTAFVKTLQLAAKQAATVAELMDTQDLPVGDVLLENTAQRKRARTEAHAQMLATANAALHQSTIVLKNSDPIYSIRITIGTPGQPLDVIPDTGSTHLVITSVYCEEAGCKQADHSYDPAKSDTYVSMTPENLRKKGEYTAISITYGSGQLTAILGDDTVHMGDAKVEHVVFGQIMREVGQVFMIDGFDGILGFSAPRDGESKKSAESVDLRGTNDYMAEQRVLSKNWYKFFFSYDTNIDGTFSLPTHDDDLSSFKFHDLIDPPKELVNTPDEGVRPYWELKIDDIRVGGESIELCGKNTECTAIVDTGTTLLVGGVKAVTAIEKRLKIDENCGNFHELPDLEFVIDGEVYALTPDDYVMAAPQFEIRQRSVGPYALPELRETIICASALMADSPYSPMMQAKETWILGVAFLRRFESVFDYDNKRIGFRRAEHAHDDQPVDVGRWVREAHKDDDKNGGGWQKADPSTLFG